MLHQLLVRLIAFLADSEIGYHCRQSRSNGAIQCGNASAAGDGVAARHLFKNSLTVKSTNMGLNYY